MQFENWSGVFPLPLVAAWLALCLQTNTEYTLMLASLFEGIGDREEVQSAKFKVQSGRNSDQWSSGSDQNLLTTAQPLTTAH